MSSCSGLSIQEGNPKSAEEIRTSFAVGDKVMQIENDYDKEVYNGDIGYVEAIDLELGEMTIAFDGRPVTYAFGELDQIVLAYATTIHKSQGWNIPLQPSVTTQHYMMLQRNLLYTGVTRGKRLVILLGQKKAGGDRRQERLRPAAVVKATGMVSPSPFAWFEVETGPRRCCRRACCL